MCEDTKGAIKNVLYRKTDNIRYTNRRQTKQRVSNWEWRLYNIYLIIQMSLMFIVTWRQMVVAGR